MLRSEVIEYDDGEVKARIVVQRASFLGELARTDLLNAGLAESAVNEQPESSNAVGLLMRDVTRSARIVVWPALAGATAEAWFVTADDTQAWPLTFDQTMSLPGDLVNQWIEAIWKLNPQWSPKAETPEKKD
jgi:hypothetical protein